MVDCWSLTALSDSILVRLSSRLAGRERGRKKRGMIGETKCRYVCMYVGMKVTQTDCIRACVHSQTDRQIDRQQERKEKITIFDKILQSVLPHFTGRNKGN